MLVHRWLILRSPLPQRFTVGKVVALVNVLAKLQNFCIGQNDNDFEPADEEGGVVNPPTGTPVTRPTREDADNGIIDLDNAIVQIEVDPEFGVDRPSSLLDGGCHFDDYPRSLRRTNATTTAEFSSPREVMRRQVEDSHLVRPNAPVEV